MNLKGPSAFAFSRDTLSFTSNSQTQAVGSFGYDSFGNRYRYVKAGALALVPGTVVAAPAANTGHLNLAFSATPAVGAQSVTITPDGSANIAAQAYQGGKLLVSNGASAGYSFGIASQSLGNSTTNVVIVLDSSEALVVAGNSVSRCDLFLNPFNGVVINSHVGAAQPVGVAICAIPAGQYGYVVDDGLVPCLCDGSIGIQAGISPSDLVDGAVMAFDSANTDVSIGVSAQAGVDTKYKMCKVRF